VQIESKNNKNILKNPVHVFESIMQRLKKGTTEGDFWSKKKLKKRHHVLKKLFYGIFHF
jgi:hypothetical protein